MSINFNQFKNMNNGKKKKILVIEDDESLAQAVQFKLERAGYEVVMCETAEKGLASLAEKVPDFIWLDILLPGMSGLDFLQELRKNPAYKELPVMIVTASLGRDRMKNAFQLNIVDVVIKSEHELKDIVNQVSEYFQACSGEC